MMSRVRILCSSRGSPGSGGRHPSCAICHVAPPVIVPASSCLETYASTSALSSGSSRRSRPGAPARTIDDRTALVPSARSSSSSSVAVLRRRSRPLRRAQPDRDSRWGESVGVNTRWQSRPGPVNFHVVSARP